MRIVVGDRYYHLWTFEGHTSLLLGGFFSRIVCVGGVSYILGLACGFFACLCLRFVVGYCVACWVWCVIFCVWSMSRLVLMLISFFVLAVCCFFSFVCSFLCGQGCLVVCCRSLWAYVRWFFCRVFACFFFMPFFRFPSLLVLRFLRRFGVSFYAIYLRFY